MLVKTNDVDRLAFTFSAIFAGPSLVMVENLRCTTWVQPPFYCPTTFWWKASCLDRGPLQVPLCVAKKLLKISVYYTWNTRALRAIKWPAANLLWLPTCRDATSSMDSICPNHSAKEETEIIPLEDLVDDFVTFYGAGKLLLKYITLYTSWSHICTLLILGIEMIMIIVQPSMILV